VAVAVVLAVSAPACSTDVAARPSGSPSKSSSPGSGLTPSVTIELTGEAAGALEVADGALWVTHFEDTTVSRVNPDTGDEVAVVEVGPNPGGMAPVGNSLWIEHFTHDASLTAIDPTNGEILQEVSIGRPCCDIGLAGGDLWVLGPDDGLQRLDGRSGRVLATTDIPIDPNVNANMVATDDALWLASEGDSMLRVDPRSGRVTHRVDIGRMLPYAVGPDGLVWCGGLEGVAAVDPRTGRIVKDLDPLDVSEVISMAVDERSIWLGIRDGGGDGQLVQLSRADGLEVARTPVSLPLRMREFDGTLWVTDYFENRLLGFDA
jgi:ligand-binding sensor domain-containing protein